MGELRGGGGYPPDVAPSYGGEVKQIWRNKGHGAGFNRAMQRRLKSVLTQLVAYSRKTGRKKRRGKKTPRAHPN